MRRNTKAETRSFWKGSMSNVVRLTGCDDSTTCVIKETNSPICLDRNAEGQTKTLFDTGTDADVDMSSLQIHPLRAYRSSDGCRSSFPVWNPSPVIGVFVHSSHVITAVVVLTGNPLSLISVVVGSSSSSTRKLGSSSLCHGCTTSLLSCTAS